ncbi:MAG: DUF4350 domain-containing protein, partial [Bifidobacteriaceae bacterium]|nr:DUF4350 domain-containing protein [Bifidobacteriaceae bacterium]
MTAPLPGTAADPFALPGAAADPFALPGAPAGRRGPRRRGKAVAGWAAGVGIPLALALVMTALLRAPTDSTPLSVTNPGAGGARAVAQVLGRCGVDVIAAKTTAQAVAQAYGDATLVIAGYEPVSERQLEAYAGARTDIVLIAPDPELYNYLDERVGAGGLTVMRDASVFTNEGVVEYNNAATALRTLGGHRRVIWSVARWEDGPAPGSEGLWQ